MKDPVRGTAQVVAASIPPRGVKGWSNCSLDLVVQAEGMKPYAKTLTSWLTPTSKWPFPGQTLPVTVDRADPDRVKIEWDEVQSTSDRAFEDAQQLAARLAGAQAPPGGGSVPPEAASIVTQLQQLFPGATVNVEEPATVTIGGEAGGDDAVAQLERLAKLHADGALTDEEFEAAKNRILGTG
jgi:hypothetical protein